MSKGLHLKPRQPLEAGQNWNEAAGIVTLNKAGNFTVEIVKTDALRKEAPQKLPLFNKLTQEQVWQMPDIDDRKQYVEEHKKREKQEKQYELDKEKYDAALLKDLDNLSWCWETVGKGMTGRKITHNNSFSKGVPSDLCKLIKYPKILEGSGLTWLEVFTENDPAECVVPHGLFIKAIGTPKIIDAEWRDYSGQKITEEIAFGSTIYLHIYTEALYGDHIEIQLRDTKFVNADLTPTPSDKDGDPIQKLEAKPLTRFRRQVNIHKYDVITKPPAGTIIDAIINNDQKEQTSNANVQKCVFPVFVEQAWQFQGAGLFDSGSKLSINPIVYHSKIEHKEKDLDDCVLNVSKNGILMQGKLTGNNPLMQDDPDKGDAPEEQKKIDFTFGVFIDGTNNNRYDTIARIDWEKKRIGRIETKEKPFTNEEHLKVYAKNKKEVGENENYMYNEGSYENDLSNVAILFDNYKKDDINIFKIYTEGMNTNTLADKDMNVIKYKSNDFFMGGAFGAGNSGIVDRVHRTIEQLVDKIAAAISNEKIKKIDLIKIDVFGFSRGAASARHFVHEITLPSYKTGLSRDHSGLIINTKYANLPLPSNGYLGYLLSEKGIEFNRLIIRFAGLYDTVAHHGLVQFNDIKDLGLNSINKAKYVIHMVAAEEHRKNFSLSPIIKSQNHIELYMPGVHCDVGGSYIEGRPEGIAAGIAPDPAGEHILATDYCDNTVVSPTLNKFRDILIKEGWFKADQIGVRDAYNNPYKYDSSRSSLYDTQQLVSQRAYISNQYSFIPLHMMCNFAIEKGLKFDYSDLIKTKNFQKNIFPKHVSFIEKIKTYLVDYATKAISNPLEVIEHEIPVEDMKQLRNHYLHYNATSGVVNAPEPERKRFIIKG
ncbi:MAG: DUF2235 domain-containing protein [Flavobacterium sp.]|nr:MAG: DUF2235 domain-containing protein [Flavobacterium sp.]